jgi:hypothetical protein
MLKIEGAMSDLMLKIKERAINIRSLFPLFLTPDRSFLYS